MNSTKKKLFVLLFLIPTGCLSQSANSNINFYGIKDSVDNYYYNLANQFGDSILMEESSGYGAYKMWSDFWDRRLSPHGNFLIYDSIKKEAMNVYCNYTPQHPSANWNEIGPTAQPIEASPFNTGHQVGIGRTSWITFDPNNHNSMFTGSPWGGLFHSSNGGQSWVNGGTDQFCQPAAAYCAVSYQNSDTWFLATGDGEGFNSPGYNKSDGVWRTTDGGSTWEQIGNAFNLDGNNWDWQIKKLLIDPNDANVVYAATYHGVFKTSNALDVASNVTWINLTYSNFPFAIYDIEFKPNSSNILYASGSKIIYSNNSGGTWNYLPNSQAITINVSRIAMEVTLANPDILYAVFIDLSIGAHLWKYDDATTLWVDKGIIYNTGNSAGVVLGRAQSFCVSPSDPDIIYIGDVQPVCKCSTATNPNSCSWAKVGLNQVHDDINSIKFDSSPTSPALWAATDGGVFKSTDGGNNWAPANNGLGVSTIESASVSETDSNYMIAGMFDDGTNVYNNYNSGNKWRHVYPCDCYAVAMDRTTPMRQFGSCNTSYMVRSDDFGTNFNNSVPLYFIAGGVAAIQNTKTPNIWYQSGAEVRKNTNSGSGSWVPISNFSNLSPAQYVAGVWTTPASGDYLIVSLTYYTNGNGNYHDLYITRNANDANPLWSLLTQPINQNHWVHGIAGDYDDPEVFYISYDGCNSNEQVFKYNGHLNQWTNLSYNLSNLCMNEIAVEKGSDGGLYIGTDMGVYYTNNKRIQQYPNSEWIRYSTNLPRIDASRMIINYVTNNVYTGTFGRGIWRSGLACPDDYDLTLSGAHTDYFYEAQHAIASTASIANNVKVKYRGGYAVEMNPGFIADVGSTFEAYIHPCDHEGNSFRQTSTEIPQETISTEEVKPLDKIILYPNPTTGNIVLLRGKNMIEEEDNDKLENIKVSLYDIMGRNVYANIFSGRKLNIDLSHCNKGMYLVQLKDDKGNFVTKKLILQ